MQKAGRLLGGWTQAWMSVRMASSGLTRRNPLSNKVALVTASTDGIGFAIARRLAEDGAHVVVSSRKQQNVDRAVATLQGEGLSVTGIVCHVGKAEDREKLITTALKRHQGIDILVSNAAVNPFFGNLMDVTEEVWDKVLSINVTATAMMIKAVVPEMEKRGGGSVVIVGSVAGFTRFPSLGPYNVSKTALLGLTKNFAAELAPKNIRVNCLAPGLIKTRFSSVLWEEKAREDFIKEAMQIRRLGKPEDCAGIVSFLCSEDASYINGETVVVGGGTPSRL
ncbi:dehydrogenase/reductase SDR family member 4 isoform 1 [Mus musculus]|uniref:Dehydrogenase/reductase SDR family member 4 n=2 Tax=Mus musculus TaxID=10090 RepID=DHRS4_MOUSE|nr:dehydrogenase/reductase SDR family member 4 isoform 1 [Mus musculus]Q99LB2.3 RecName: Full=Dehydrogenase/reductase SDR family member 4; AltName: Full=NADPH-dependent carbonyl reductase; Short=CR; AltName: Full=NADPH-dependent retinol dehydrogenase/reductase; Short=NDRD; Short=mouNRDR; AltName: Full=Peroxisomal short-chain alcohol dehydrogenase; Short=PSCD; AltName: Full=Short chain dehydrogenase/reductase family 25C member 2; Short=Protein SDR25C2 [Mus musculus]EDL36299.1 dehydrogenase/reducta|eukprot:NP_001033027.2 dehydrogenase/reductase SDR family member 4 isoform 1 [Mus musculus]